VKASFGPNFALERKGDRINWNLAVFVTCLHIALGYFVRSVSVLFEIASNVCCALVDTAARYELLCAGQVLTRSYL